MTATMQLAAPRGRPLPSVDQTLADSLVNRVVEAPVRTPRGSVNAIGYETSSGDEYVAMVYGEGGHGRAGPTRVHVHVQCQVNDVFGRDPCACGSQLRSVLEDLGARGGVVLYVSRGDAARLRHLTGPNPTAIVERPDRDSAIAHVLLDLGFSEIEVSSNEPLDVRRVEALGLTVRLDASG